MAAIDLTLAHSPDSDDLVMWWPLTGMRDASGVAVEGAAGRALVDTGAIRFRTLGEDVERLNQMAIAGEPGGGYDITAISCYTYPFIRDRYAITSCGGSFGEGYGPKVVVREGSPVEDVASLRGRRVAVPGTRTTAFLTLSLMLGAFEHEAMLFSEVPGAVASGRADAGLLIHEAQLTCEREGLRVIGDVGAWWRDETGLALPLGLNVVRRDLDGRHGAGTVRRVSELLSASVRAALAEPEMSRQYLVLHGADRPEWSDPALVDRYLAMYVSDMTVDMGEAGRDAIARLLGEGHRAGLCPDAGEIDVIPGRD